MPRALAESVESSRTGISSLVGYQMCVWPISFFPYKVGFLIRIIKFLLQRARKCRSFWLVSCKELFCLLSHMVSVSRRSTQ